MDPILRCLAVKLCKAEVRDDELAEFSVLGLSRVAVLKPEYVCGLQIAMPPKMTPGRPWLGVMDCMQSFSDTQKLRGDPSREFGAMFGCEVFPVSFHVPVCPSKHEMVTLVKSVGQDKLDEIGMLFFRATAQCFDLAAKYFVVVFFEIRVDQGFPGPLELFDGKSTHVLVFLKKKSVRLPGMRA